jgi:putative transcriptional regulator
VKNPAGIKAFGSHLRSLREARNLSQQELADLADIAKKTIQRIENGKYSVTMDVLICVTNALEMKLEDVVAFKLPKEKMKKA